MLGTTLLVSARLASGLRRGLCPGQLARIEFTTTAFGEDADARVTVAAYRCKRRWRCLQRADRLL